MTLVVKIKITNFFPFVFVGDLRKFMLAKISRYIRYILLATEAWGMVHT